MKLQKHDLKKGYQGENTLQYLFTIGTTRYAYYYHKLTDTTHCNCSAYENDHNDKLIKQLSNIK